MKNIRPDFEVWEKYISELPPGYQKITCHMIFYVNIRENFIRKAQFVADGHKTKTPAAMTYSSLVSKGLVMITLTIAALNDLDMLDCVIPNDYLTLDCRDWVWVVSGADFVSEAGNNMLVRKALYVLKIFGAAFKALLAETLDTMGYRPSYSNPDLWLRPEVDPYGFKYYEYVL